MNVKAIIAKIVIDEIKWSKRKNAGTLVLYDEVMLGEIELALERQIPETPIVAEGQEYSNGEPFNFIVCPCCDYQMTDIFDWEDLKDEEKIKIKVEELSLNEINYCYKCGQKLSWCE